MTYDDKRRRLAQQQLHDLRAYMHTCWQAPADTILIWIK
ncbi:hypothetical protein CAter282_2272 [Collimonas arenae]|uniref:Uncharacterized protein n=1 Tax=Collimonas arenae TaxID=279058 RepID=A0A127QKB0_9BURK|nr:hypothetical protein CAter10_2474 [Collimonas arenae]AMP10022.1 hypothetical protein CAter282_2272 [Collimonas arenae]